MIPSKCWTVRQWDSIAAAIYNQALAAAASSDHTFAIKFRLFAGGRWPLGIIGGRLLVF